MISKTELLAWLASLPDDVNLGIDEGGLTLLVDAYDGPNAPDLEIGGMSEEDGR